MSERILFPSTGAKPTGPSVVLHTHNYPSAPPMPLWQKAVIGSAGAVVAIALVVAVVLLAQSLGHHDGHGPSPSQLHASAKAWASHDLPKSFVDSLAIASKELRTTTKPLATIKAEHVERWRQARDGSFNARFERLLDEIIPAGVDKPTPEQRNRYADALDVAVAGASEAIR